MPILDPDAIEEHILVNLEETEDSLAVLPWYAFIKKHRQRSRLKRWRKALDVYRGNDSVAERRAGVIGKLIGAVIKG